MFGNDAFRMYDENMPCETCVPYEPVGSIDIAKLLGVKDVTVRSWHMRGTLPKTDKMVSGRPCWNRHDIEAWARETGRLHDSAAA